MMFEYTSFTRRAPAPEPKRRKASRPSMKYWISPSDAGDWHTGDAPGWAKSSKGKCPDCYGDGKVWLTATECPLCGGGGSVSAEIIAQREAEYRAWLKRRVAKKPRRK